MCLLRTASLPFEKTSTDVAEVQRFYGAVLQLKPFPPHFFAFCPVNVGVSYQLDFLQTESLCGAGSTRRRLSRRFDPGVLTCKSSMGKASPNYWQKPSGYPYPKLRWGGTGIEDSAPPGGPFAPPPH